MELVVGISVCLCFLLQRVKAQEPGDTATSINSGENSSSHALSNPLDEVELSKQQVFSNSPCRFSLVWA